VLRLNSGMKAKPRTQSPKPLKIPAPFVQTDKSKLLRPASGWLSLLLCVETYKANVLATAIEQYGIFVYDRFNRRVVATDDPSSDLDSKNYALDLLASVAEEERNPGPIPSWDHERWEIEDHPLQRFGWPKESLPDLEVLKNFGNGNAQIPMDWTQRTKLEFEDEYKKTGTYEAAGKLHGVSRQRYKTIFDRQTGMAQQKSQSKRATALHNWMQPVARKK
jgi:hypothetical protein